jgi:histidinol dehydrogenase
MVVTLSTRDAGFNADFAKLLDAKREVTQEVDDAVAAIIADVRARGDAALIELTARFDRLELTPATLAFVGRDRRRLRAGPARGPRRAGTAAERIRAYHARQMPEDARWTDDARARSRLALDAGGGGRALRAGGLASYPVLGPDERHPAEVAGVERLVICAPTPEGWINPLVLFAARLAGVETIYRIGGAQAVAALAYGTESVAPVDKITGPGNAWVAAAKRRVFGRSAST